MGSNRGGSEFNIILPIAGEIHCRVSWIIPKAIKGFRSVIGGLCRLSPAPGAARAISGARGISPPRKIMLIKAAIAKRLKMSFFMGFAKAPSFLISRKIKN